MNQAEHVLSRLRGEICWGATYDTQLNLSLNFGPPHLSIREPRPESKSAALRRRGVRAVGTWWLWVYVARWKLSLADGTSVTGRASLKRIRQALSRFDGERLDGASVKSSTGALRLTFDFGVTLEVHRFNRGDADDLWLLYGPSDGLTDEVISDLSRISALRVISRNSSMTLKGTTKETPTLARELGVSHLVTGTVRRAGSALRITADLVETMTDTPIWSEKFSGTMDDVFGIQEEISRQIVAALEVRLTTAEDRGVAERPIDDPVAYDCYLRAKEVMNSWTSENQHRAMRLIDDAIEILGDSGVSAANGRPRWTMTEVPSLDSTR